MKNKLPEDSLFKKKGFFVALYSCVGVVLILAAVVSYINIKQAKPNAGQSQNISGELDQASASKTSPNPALATPSTDEALIAQAQQNAAKDAAASQQQAANSIAKAKPTATPTPAPVPTNAPAAPAPAKASAPEATAAPAATPTVVPDKAQKADKSLAEPVFNSFKDGDTMDWPLQGDIVLDYSTSRLVYDETLDQYRTNDSIWISASPGAPVKAAIDGVVQKIDKTRKDGTTVTIDDGNGWTTTYGQLLDSVLVKEGDVVKRGQIIGGVSNPTIYGVLQGPHLSFQVAKDDVTVDPKTVLQAQDTQTVAASK
jgi:murein DD-endopeptidase MepM/ murein hydrolase activator NlpD